MQRKNTSMTTSQNRMPPLFWAMFPTSAKSASHISSKPIHGRPQKFFQRGAKSPTLQRIDTVKKNGLKYRVSIASTKGASENFRVFCRTAEYDVIFSNSRGGGQVPPCPPLRAHMDMVSSCSLDYTSETFFTRTCAVSGASFGQ